MAEYQALFPGFEELIAAEYASLSGTTDAPRPRVASAAEQQFLARLEADRARGALRPLVEYLREFPLAEARIVAEMAAIPATGLAPDIGQRIGPYRVLSILGQGGQGRVYLAEDTRLGRTVALKVLSDNRLFHSEDAVRRLQREAAIASRLDHPGICTVFEAGVHEGTAFVAMQYVQGRSLAQVLAEEPSEDLTRAEILRRAGWIEQAARAMQVAHENGVVHRDLKPSNLMLREGDRVITLDFGLARSQDADHSLTRTGDVFGTPAYLAPELLGADLVVAQPAADLYALGVSLYECLSGQRPFRGATREALYRAILNDRPDDLLRLQPAVPRDLAIVVATALDRDPRRRYASAAALADDLLAVIESRPIQAALPSPRQRILRWIERDPLRAALTSLLALALILAAGLGGYVAAQRTRLKVGQQTLEQQRVDALVVSALGLAGGSSDLAGQRLQRALDTNPELAVVRATLALLSLDHERPEVSHRLLEEIPAEQQGEPAFRRLQQLLLERAGQSEEAEAIATALGDQTSALREYVEGWILYNRAVPDDDDPTLREAISHLDRAILWSHRPEMAFHTLRAQAHFQVDDFAALDEDAAALRQLWPEAPATWLWTGMARRLYHHDREGSARALDEAIEREPEYPEAILMRSMIHAELGEMDASREQFERGLQLATGRPGDNVHRQLLARGRTLLILGHPGDAEGPLRRALALKPADVTTRVALAQSAGQLGSLEEAIELLQRVREDAPDHADASHWLVTFLSQNDEALAAEEELRRRLERAPDDALAWLWLAELLEDEDPDEARHAARRASLGREQLEQVGGPQAAALDGLLERLGLE